MLQRILKILTILIVLLILGFLSLGLFKPQVAFETEAEVDGNLTEVFALFNNKEKINQWIPSVKSITPLKETENIKGSVYQMLIENNGNEMKLEEKVLDYRENELVSLSFDAGPMHKTDEYTFAQAGDKTKIVGQHTVQGSNYFYKCMFALAGKSMQVLDQENIDSFKKYFERINVGIKY